MIAEILVTGIVQGVGFRPFIYRLANANKLTGYVQNRADAGVKIVIEGRENCIRNFVQDIKENRPPLARIYDIKIKEYENSDSNEFNQFSIYKSSLDIQHPGSVIPPDASICDNCVVELQDLKNRRSDYFFITCTDCGPRFTTIEQLPYDRPNTTMVDFPMCNDCAIEYNDPLNRRFHAQTIACHACGPKVLLVNRGSSPRCKRCDYYPCTLDLLLDFGITASCANCDPNVFLISGENGVRTEYNSAIREAGKLIEEGYIVAIKGNGGFHIATSTIKPEPLERLRDKKYRGNKPFAIMARDLDAVKSFAEVSEYEEQLLKSYVKPIVLLKKKGKRNYFLSDLVSPGLDRVGVMLPYTGLHFMLFESVKELAFVMTSANAPNEPIITDNGVAMKKLGHIVDFFLLHNRKIAQKADDSVVRMHGKDKSIIRRSRGFAPEPIYLKKRILSTKKNILGLGAELNVTSCLLLGNKEAIISQHIGDVERFEALKFLRESTEHIVRLANSNIDLVTCDLHPRFNTTKLAHELADKFKCPVVRVQHHHAHVESLMAEHDIDNIIGIACDGYGYGPDGMAWGGEVLDCREDGRFERVGHLASQPLVGGDLATKYPLRMVAAILHDKVEIYSWLLDRVKYFPYGKKELDIIQRQLDAGDVRTTSSSCGRILDAVSALLDICYDRTYEGEPAMKLESVAGERGRESVLNIRPKVSDGMIIDTSYLMKEIFENLNNYSVSDLAYSAQYYVAQGLAGLAVRRAKQKKNVDAIGFSGGVAHNEFITKVIREVVEESGLKFFGHNLVPPGDGGISFGQVCAAGMNMLDEKYYSP